MRIWNTRENAHDQVLQGILRANPGKYQRLSTKYGYGLYLNYLPKNQVRIIINGGGGYGPMWSGFADEGLADAMVHGEFDSAPNAYVLYEMAKTIDSGRGVLFLTNHFMGDYLNNDMAVELLARDGIQAEVCYATDDMFSCKGEPRENRGGLHGIGQICKLAAVAARRGFDLETVKQTAEKTNSRLLSLSVNVRDGQMLFGEGFSGEPAACSFPYHCVDELAKEACRLLLEETRPGQQEACYLSVNSHCSVGYTESFVLLNVLASELEASGIRLCGCAVGTYLDVFEGAGCMISLLGCDEEMEKYLCPVAGYGFRV